MQANAKISRRARRAGRPLRIKRSDIPALRTAREPDTPAHRWGRRILLGLVVGLYASLAVGWLLGAVKIKWASSVGFGALIAIAVPAIEYGVRPGKGKSWLLTLVVLVAISVAPLLVVFLPLGLLVVQAVRLRRGH